MTGVHGGAPLHQDKHNFPPLGGIEEGFLSGGIEEGFPLFTFYSR